MERLRYLIPLGVLAGLVTLFAVNLDRDPTRVPSPLIGRPAPAFRLPLLGGNPPVFSLADLRGHPVLVNFFASWCPDCRVEQPYLLQLARQDHVAIYGVDYKDTRRGVRQMLGTLGNPYRKVILDRAGNMGINWGVYGVPATFVLSAKGIILYKQIGPLTPSAWQRHIEPLMEDRS